MGRKALPGRPDGGLGHLLEGHRAVAFERRDPGVRSRRHHRARQPRRYRAVEVLPEIGAARRRRPGSDAVDDDDLARLRQPDQDRRDAGDADHGCLDDARDQTRGHARVDGVAAPLEHVERGLRRQAMTGRDRVPDADPGGTALLHRHRAGTSALDGRGSHPRTPRTIGAAIGVARSLPRCRGPRPVGSRGAGGVDGTRRDSPESGVCPARRPVRRIAMAGAIEARPRGLGIEPPRSAAPAADRSPFARAGGAVGRHDSRPDRQLRQLHWNLWHYLGELGADAVVPPQRSGDGRGGDGVAGAGRHRDLAGPLRPGPRRDLPRARRARGRGRHARARGLPRPPGRRPGLRRTHRARAGPAPRQALGGLA